jgi:hypothetical protein
VGCGGRAREVERKMISILVSRGFIYMFETLIHRLDPLLPSQPTSHPVEYIFECQLEETNPR